MAMDSVAGGSVTLRRGVLADVLVGAAPRALARNAALVVSGAALTGVAAQVAVPIEPISAVPISGQTFAVLLVGAALGPWRGLASMLVYLVAGLAGLPWFAEGASGAGSASFGYVLGFVVAAALVGELARRGGDRTVLRTAGTMVVGNLAIYAFGVAWLVAVVGLAAGEAMWKGVVPFLLGDAVKLALAAGLLPGAWRLVDRFAGRTGDAETQ